MNSGWILKVFMKSSNEDSVYRSDMTALVFMNGTIIECNFCEKENKNRSFFVNSIEYFPHFLYTIVTGG